MQRFNTALQYQTAAPPVERRIIASQGNRMNEGLLAGADPPSVRETASKEGSEILSRRRAVRHFDFSASAVAANCAFVLYGARGAGADGGLGASFS